MRQSLFLKAAVAVLLVAGCASKPPVAPSEEEAFTPNWETHANDAEVINSRSVSAATSVTVEDERALEVQQFATINYKSLGQDLKAGKGKHLNELMRILKIPGGEKRAAATRRVKSLFEGSSDSSQFADNLWRWYQSQASN